MDKKTISEAKREAQDAKYRAFATVYIAMSKIQGKESARKAAARVVGIRNERTAIAYQQHPIVAAEMKKHFDAMILKYQKTADDVLDSIAKIAFGEVKGDITHGDKLRALGMLAQHHRLINRASEGEDDDGEGVRIYIPDNKRNPSATKVVVGVQFSDTKSIKDAPQQDG